MNDKIRVLRPDEHPNGRTHVMDCVAEMIVAGRLHRGDWVVVDHDTIEPGSPDDLIVAAGSGDILCPLPSGRTYSPLVENQRVEYRVVDVTGSMLSIRPVAGIRPLVAWRAMFVSWAFAPGGDTFGEWYEEASKCQRAMTEEQSKHSHYEWRMSSVADCSPCEIG